MRIALFTLLFGLATTSTPALADHPNVPAAHCEVAIKIAGPQYDSHGKTNVGVILKTKWLGDGELVEAAGFYGRVSTSDLGNEPSCGDWRQYDSSGFRVWNPTTGLWQTQWGEYLFHFPVYSGAVFSDCPGYEYAWDGAFFLQTNKRTYWLNPRLDPDLLFTFDRNAANILARHGWPNVDMDYYDPADCR